MSELMPDYEQRAARLRELIRRSTELHVVETEGALRAYLAKRGVDVDGLDELIALARDKRPEPAPLTWELKTDEMDWKEWVACKGKREIAIRYRADLKGSFYSPCITVWSRGNMVMLSCNSFLTLAEAQAWAESKAYLMEDLER